MPTPAENATSRTAPLRGLIVSVVALALAVGIAWVDTRPNWDDTGVTAGALLLTAGFAAAAGLPWWGAALLVAMPVLLAELPNGAGVTLALAVTTIGSLLGAGIRRTVRAMGL
jgi:hypothetical protein